MVYPSLFLMEFRFGLSLPQLFLHRIQILLTFFIPSWNSGLVHPSLSLNGIQVWFILPSSSTEFRFSLPSLSLHGIQAWSILPSPGQYIRQLDYMVSVRPICTGFHEFNQRILPAYSLFFRVNYVMFGC